MSVCGGCIGVPILSPLDSMLFYLTVRCYSSAAAFSILLQNVFFFFFFWLNMKISLSITQIIFSSQVSYNVEDHVYILSCFVKNSVLIMPHSTSYCFTLKL